MPTMSQRAYSFVLDDNSRMEPLQLTYSPKFLERDAD